MRRAMVILGNLALCSLAGVVSWRAWENEAPEFTLIGAAVVWVGILAIYNTVTGRE